MGRGVTMLSLACVVLVAGTLPALCYVPQGTAARQSSSAAPRHGAARTYIVFVEPPPAHLHGNDEAAYRRWHESFLTALGGPGRRVRHSYSSVLSGFAARLTDAQVAAVSRKPGFLRAFPERRLHLMTTHTPAFLGLTPDRGVWNATSYGEGVVVGVLDTGIDAAHPSFGDAGMPPPPDTWKGACAPPVRCNNKLVGAASFVTGDGADDEVGHGTHTAATAAGRFVKGVSAFGLGAGTAAGTAPRAHVAMYKVCDAQGCFESDLLAGMDAAVRDGVDVVSLSLGGPSVPFDKDPVAIGAFAATAKGVPVVCACGNSGPMPSTLSNEAPWVLTTAAGSLDRSFRAAVRLGDGQTFEGESLTQDNRFGSRAYPLYYSRGSNYCDYFDDVNITGAVVVCDTETPVPPTSSIDAVRQAGGAGVVFVNEADFGYTIVLEKMYDDLPMTQVTVADGKKIMGYAMSKGGPSSSTGGSRTATIVFNSTLIGVKPAPTVAAFSSRGPSTAGPGVPKPDIMAPGLNILAAWPSTVPVGADEAGNKDGNSYNVVSGTSMATPHVTGIVALLRKVHPDWSPAAIKSAIMTTSSAVDNDGHTIKNEEHREAIYYAVGAGQVVPARAVDPGLVYDLGVRDYAGYICALIGEDALKAVAGNTTSLTGADVAHVAEAQLNYPAILVPLQSEPFTVQRTVTNVGPENSHYTAWIRAPEGLTITVEPTELEFTEVKETKTFTVSVSGGNGMKQKLVEGSLSWVSQHHVVRSPIIADASIAG
jgi:subtilisin family serine protease